MEPPVTFHSCAPLTSFVLGLPLLNFSSVPHPHPLPSTKGVMGLEKAERTGILNGDTL